jgi:hypothetical protein
VVGEADANKQLGDGDGSDGDLVVVFDRPVERGYRAVRVDEERRVEEQAGQGRSSISSSCRNEATSAATP